MGEDYSAMFDVEMSGDSAGVLFLLWLIYAIVMLAVSVIPYVLQSLGLYSIAKRRGIRNPWLSWIPVGSSWILGCISDQYQYVVKGRVRNKRKALVVLSIVQLILGAVACVMYIVCFGVLFGMIFGMMGTGMDPVITDQQIENLMMEHVDQILLMSAAYLLMACVSIAMAIIHYISLYDLYTSCEPKNNVLYLVLGIFVSICQPIFVFACRNKDDGMPPRRPEPAAYVPEPPAEPWEQNPEL